MAGNNSHWLNVRDKPAFLHRLMSELADDAKISLEGDLARGHFTGGRFQIVKETEVLKRSTLYPQQDFMVLRLTTDVVQPLFEEIMAAGLSEAIIHIQIERAGVLELGAYDNFHPECVVTGPSVSAELLEELKSKQIIRGFTVA
jgi:hypothetical protein